mmetsp:Transcript_26122/g.56649  ORF Transcript_26122/g.56649 Transcript_26122/m.56649 type:complete len:206 (-) Transcript_26122:71-688(-)|eukprot:CAMPEP_0118953336 /NCGR_PEP_ID=MMETSP1169-20130426/56384_1 /TAXON_ID=36882 /ORGANISM="Pyramimonas obovata, Strain CCMP722" /LENGTH=205 /DNA_ID=CAMNT_0006900769 /DNA_START=99 /DNA_END=716 /DNA_ORIENTATION=+
MAPAVCLTFPVGSEGGDGGVMKTILRSAPEDAEAPSKENYVCVVHYVGTLEDGTQFDSSREDDTPFTVEIGKNRVIQAWEVCLPTMKVGELCKIVCQSKYAYGEEGAPPDIPPNATLIFEVELISVRSMRRGPEVDTSKRDELKRLEELRLERAAAGPTEANFTESSGPQEVKTSAQKREEAKVAAAARLANKGQKKGGGGKKKK